MANPEIYPQGPSATRRVGRYELFSEVGAGGMATVHIGRLLGAGGFARTVAIKRAHPKLAQDPEFRRSALNEARLGSRVCHPNVVATLDAIEHDDELLVVLEYVHGDSLANLMQSARDRRERVPLPVTRALMVSVLRGLTAVHQALDEKGQPLGLIHRDVSPQNVLCGADGVVRLSDFGLAKACSQVGPTRPGEFKGKLTYAAPEQLGFRRLSPATDVFSAGLVLWELLVGRRVHAGMSPSDIAQRLARGSIPPPRAEALDVPPDLDMVAERATRKDPMERFESAQSMADAVEATGPLASADELGSWVRTLAGPSLAFRQELVASAERETTPSKRYSEFRRVHRKERGGRPLVQQLLALAIGVVIAFALVRWLLPHGAGVRDKPSKEQGDGMKAPATQIEPSDDCATPADSAAAACR